MGGSGRGDYFPFARFFFLREISDHTPPAAISTKKTGTPQSPIINSNVWSSKVLLDNEDSISIALITSPAIPVISTKLPVIFLFIPVFIY